jgi:dipeptidyl aminopeptidase/acylaminoacyl peptidase
LRRALGAALAIVAAAASAAELPPPPGITVEGAAPIPAALAEGIAPYTRFRPHALASWHPERRELLAIAPVQGVDQLQRVPEPGVAPQPLTEGDAPVVDGAYPPAGDGALAAFTRREKKGLRLYMLDVAQRKATALSGADEPVTAWTWSTKGDRIGYAARESDFPRASTVVRLADPRRPESSRVLARLPGGEWGDLRFSDDGRRLALVETRSRFDARLWLVDTQSGRARRVTRVDPAHPAIYAHPRFSADGRALFALSDRGSEFRRLVRIPLEGRGAERVLTAHIAHDIDDFDLSYDARKIAFVDDEDGADVLRFIDLATLKETPRPPLVPGVIGGLAWRPRSEEIGFHIASARSAGDVFSYDVPANRLTRWTNGNNPALNTSAFAEPATIRWKSADGREIRALLYRPPERFAGKRPVVVRLREGARSQARPGFLGADDYLLNELGIAIVVPSLRGSAGSGKTFLRLGEGPRRVGPMQDLEGLLVRLAGEARLDGSRVALAGSGEGAALALGFAARHPGRAAAIAASGGLAGAGASIAARIATPLLLAEDASAAVEARRIRARLQAEHEPAWLLLVSDGAGFGAPARARFLEAAEAQFLRGILLR